MEQMMREMGFDAGEISLERRDVAAIVRRCQCSWLCKEIELRLMQLETVDLLMMEGMRAYERFGPEEFSACKSETGVRRERTIFVEPGTNGALRDLAMIPPA